MARKRIFDLSELTIPQLDRLMSEVQVELAVRKEAEQAELDRLRTRDEAAKAFCSEVLSKQRLQSMVAPAERIIPHPTIANMYAIVGFKFSRDGGQMASGWAQINTQMIWESPRVIYDGQLGKKTNLRRVFIVELQEKDVVRITGIPTFSHEVFNRLSDFHRVMHGKLVTVEEGEYYRAIRQLRLLEAIEPALTKTETKLHERQNGKDGEEKLTRLMEVLSDLREIKKAVLDGKVPPPEERVVMYANFVLSEWKTDDEYIESLKDIVDKYSKL